MFHLRQRLIYLYLVLLFISIALVAGAPAPPVLVVIVPVADMHSAPTEDSDIVSQAILGSNVSELQRNGDWVKVTTSDQYSGWTPLHDLRDISATGGYAVTGEAAQVKNLFANLYRDTDVTAHQPVITVPFETRLEVVAEGQGDDERWLKVRLPDQRLAWIQRGDVDLHPKPLTIPESIALARRFLGFPYLWGGRSAYGYDCSGFTQMLVRSRGINMPRDADLQAAWQGVAAIERKDLQPGDLLFFGRGPDKITHTAMYIGDGQFIHDTTHGHPVVQISRLDDDPWTRILVACRRVK